MLRVPVGLEIGVDLGVDQENTRRAFLDPGTQGVEIGKRPHGRGTRSKTARDSRKIRFRKLHNIDRITLAAEIVHFSGVGAVIVDKNAQPQSKADRSFEIRDRHQKSAVAGAEHGQLAGIRDRKTNHGSEPKPDRLERMAEARRLWAGDAKVARNPAAEVTGVRGNHAILWQNIIDSLAQGARIDELRAGLVEM